MKQAKTVRLRVSFEYDWPIALWTEWGWSDGTLRTERGAIRGGLESKGMTPLRLRVERVEKKRGKR